MANPNKALWEKGDFTRIAETMRESGEALVGTLGISEGLEVLDLGCGDGTTALPGGAARAPTCSASTSPATSSRPATQRAQSLGPRPTAGSRKATRPTCTSSTTTASTSWSASSARCSRPKPFDVAKEMVRVTRPGGRIVMGNWIPNDPTLVAQILKISSAYSPPPPEGFVSPMTWGVEEQRDRALRRRRRARKRTSRSSETPTRSTSRARRRSFVAEFRTYYGPTMNAFDAAAAERPRGRPAGASWRRCSTSQNTEREPGRHLHPRDLPARDGRRLTMGLPSE